MACSNQAPPSAPGSSQSAGTSLEANLKHITVTLSTWDAVWKVYKDPKWARQRLRLYGAQDRALEQFLKKLEEDVAEVSMERHGHAKQLVVFFGAAGIGTGGGWGADAVLRACCMVVCRPRGTDQRRGRVVLADEHRTTRVSSAVNGQQPCERQLNKRRATRPADWKPPPGQVEQCLVRPAWSQQRDQRVRGLMWCPVVAPRKPPQAPRSSQVATLAAASEPGPSTPSPAQRSKRTKAEPAAEPTKGKGQGQGKATKAKPAPQPGRRIDGDLKAMLNMQRIGESSPVRSALLTSLLFMPAQVLAPLQANNARSEGLNGKPSADSADCNWLQVIKVPGGSVLHGCKKTKRKLKAHFQLRAEVHSQLRVIASLFVLRILLTCLVGYPSPGFRSAPLPPAVQPPRAQDAAPLPPLPLRVPAQPAAVDMDWDPEAEAEPEPEPEPAPAPPTLRPPSARLAARHPPPAAPTGPPLPLDSEDPTMLQQLQVFCMYFANSTFLTPYNQLQRRLGRARQNKHFSLKPAFDDPSNQELLAKLQQLGSTKLTGDHNTISHHSMQLAVAMQQHYSNPGNLISDSPELQACNLDKGHVNDLKEEAAKQRRLLALEEGDSLCLEQWQQPPTPPVPGKPKHGGRQLLADQLRRWKLTKGQVKHGGGMNNARCATKRWLAPIKPHLQHLAAASPAGTSLEANLKHITVTLATWDAVWEVSLDPKWARQRLRLYGAQDRTLEHFFKKLEEEMAEVAMKRHGRAKQLVVFFGATSIGTRGGWGADAVLRACCMVVCRPRGTDQRRGRVVLADEHRTTRVSSAVNGQQPCERQLNKRRATRPADWKPPPGQVEQCLVRPAWSQQRDQRVRGLMWCPVVAPRKPPQAPRSSQVATLAAASEPGPSTPSPAQRSKRTKAEPAAEPTKGKGQGQGKATKAKPAPQPGRRIDGDLKAMLNMQRIGESR
ncbi:hypothetical protein QJQ45_013751 [Haematococcus lacustris]|nr:hypothetical protein QJQ45_013751 [Haematococcus lacustris]